MTVDKNLVSLVRATSNYGMDKEYTGEIYLLLYGGDEYPIAENFFENFPELKSLIPPLLLFR